MVSDMLCLLYANSMVLSLLLLSFARALFVLVKVDWISGELMT
jgi:hypothetical protein